MPGPFPGPRRHKSREKKHTTNPAATTQVENEARASLPSKQGAPAEQTSLLTESIYKLSGQLSTITRNQKYFRTRENRNFSTVRSTESRIFRFSVIENLVMVGMAGLQVFVVRFFFQGARKGMCGALGWECLRETCADGAGCRVCVDGVCRRCLEGSVVIGNGSAHGVGLLLGAWRGNMAIHQIQYIYANG